MFCFRAAPLYAGAQVLTHWLLSGNFRGYGRALPLFPKSPWDAYSQQFESFYIKQSAFDRAFIISPSDLWFIKQIKTIKTQFGIKTQ